MRHSLNIVVAVVSMAAGAWQGTTAPTEEPGSTANREQSPTASQQVTLRGCVQRGEAAGLFVLVTPEPASEPGLDPASAPAVRSEDNPSADTRAADPRLAQPVSYELVAGKPEVDLAALVGKRVEAQGTPERTARGATSEDSPGAAAAAADSPTGTSGAASQRSRVRVRTIRPVGGPCE